MDAEAARQFLIDHFRAHAIKGELKPTRTYEVIEQDAAHLKICTRNGGGRWVQSLFADLVTCKSLKYGEFRRVDLFWGVERKGRDADAVFQFSTGATADDDTFRVSIPGPAFTPSGEPVPVDAFMARGSDRHSSRRSRKEKSA
ncbi:hypothetical protein K8I61_04995 [bacterium]|nr:hypothetical protein [bacterium]